ncbi:hypothetical protein ABTE86_15300 [Acinetobacter baumannii]
MKGHIIGSCVICGEELTTQDGEFNCFNPKCEDYRNNLDVPEGWTITPFNSSFSLPEKPKFKYGQMVVLKPNIESNKLYSVFARELFPSLNFCYGCRHNGSEEWFRDTDLQIATEEEIALGHRVDNETLIAKEGNQ